MVPAGDDSSSGSLAKPWRNIQTAANRLLAGDTVLIRAGTYEEQIVIKRSGERGRKIKYKAYPGETPVPNGKNLHIKNGGGLSK